jgi:hypothetical protein
LEKKYLIETQGETDMYMTLFGPGGSTVKIGRTTIAEKVPIRGLRKP